MENDRGYQRYGALSRERFGSEGSTRNAFSYVIDTGDENIVPRSSEAVEKRKTPALLPKSIDRNHTTHKRSTIPRDWNSFVDSKLKTTDATDGRDPRLLFQLSNDRVNGNKHNESNGHQSNSVLLGSKLMDIENQGTTSNDAERETLLKKQFPSIYYSSSIEYDEDTKQLQEEIRNQRDSDIKMFSSLANPEDADDVPEESEENYTYLQKAMLFWQKEIYEELVYNEKNPEFSTKQQITWACFIGIVMGIYTGT